MKSLILSLMTIMVSLAPAFASAEEHVVCKGRGARVEAIEGGDGVILTAKISTSFFSSKEVTAIAATVIPPSCPPGYACDGGTTTYKGRAEGGGSIQLKLYASAFSNARDGDLTVVYPDGSSFKSKCTYKYVR